MSDQEFILDLAGEHALSVSESSVAQRRVDHDFVFCVGKTFELPVRQTEAPGLFIIRGAIGNPVGVLGERMEMGTKFAERHAPVYRPAVVDNVQVINSKVDDTAPSASLM